ncbi:AAA family ATPase, partial [bacterium]|nr:AAA family ATPase [bacterium]
QIREWWEEWPNANIGVRLGPESGFCDIEYDDREGELTAEELLTDVVTPTYKSKRSIHRLFRLPVDYTPRKAVEKVRGLEIRFGTGGKATQSVFPPSRHKSGVRYTWLDNRSIDDIEIADFPATVVDLLNTHTSPDTQTSMFNGGVFEVGGGSVRLDDHVGAKSGQRRDMLLVLIGRELAIDGARKDLGKRALDWANRCVPAMREDEVKEVVIDLAGKYRAKGSDAVKTTEKSAELLKPPARKLMTRRLDTVEPEKVDWVWKGRIASGKLTLLVGQGGLGKTFLSVYVASVMSNGGTFTDGEQCEQGEVLILTCEDGIADTIIPRLIANGADLTKVHDIVGVSRVGSDEADMIDLSVHIEQIREKFEENPEIKLVVIDPITGFLGAKCDSNNNTSVRHVLGPFARLAEDYGVAVLCISHINKSTEQSGLNRVAGSIAFGNTARSVWEVAKDPNEPNRRLMLPTKNNLGSALGLAFSLKGETIDGGIETAVLEFEPEPIDLDADNYTSSKLTKQSDAEGWLFELINSDGPQLSTEVEKRADEKGFTGGTLKRAKKEVGIQSKRHGSTQSIWFLEGQDLISTADDSGSPADCGSPTVLD